MSTTTCWGVFPRQIVRKWSALCFRGTEELVKQSYSTFAPLDGKFDSNVILQIKNGPVRFPCR